MFAAKHWNISSCVKPTSRVSDAETPVLWKAPSQPMLPCLCPWPAGTNCGQAPLGTVAIPPLNPYLSQRSLTVMLLKTKIPEKVGRDFLIFLFVKFFFSIFSAFLLKWPSSDCTCFLNWCQVFKTASFCSEVVLFVLFSYIKFPIWSCYL